MTQDVYVVVCTSGQSHQRIVCATCGQAMSELETLQEAFPERTFEIVKEIEYYGNE